MIRKRKFVNNRGGNNEHDDSSSSNEIEEVRGEEVFETYEYVYERKQSMNSSKKFDEQRLEDTYIKTALPEKNSYHLTRIVLVKYLAFIYLVAFCVAYNQNEHLIGKNGLEPANKFMKRVEDRFVARKTFKNDQEKNLFLYTNAPTLFWFFNWSKDITYLLNSFSLLGIGISLYILKYSANSVLLFVLWLLYHSIVNVGQTFYSFGWESQLLESGFIGIFLVPFLSTKKLNEYSPPSYLAILLYRWLIFRIMLGAGLIKIRGDKCWTDYTCMNYHYETQPVPNPLSFYMHKQPESIHKFEVLSNHFLELVAPFLLILPFRALRQFGGFLQVFFQVVLIISGNLSFLNWLTILPCLACFDDRFYTFIFRSREKNSTLWTLLRNQYLKTKGDSQLYKNLSGIFQKTRRRIRSSVNLIFFVMVGFLSLPVIYNLVSSSQAMNTSFEPFRLVNTYGAFGSVTKTRYEVIFKGGRIVNGKAEPIWHEYEFKCKPGDVDRRPCVISPYHYRLDWLMWFAAFQNYNQNPWLLSLSAKFLKNDLNFTRSMISVNPFDGSNPPDLVKADLYLYKYGDIKGSNWWKRKFSRNYLPAVDLKKLEQFLGQLDWDY